MKRPALVTALGATCLALAACGDADTNKADSNASLSGDAAGAEAVGANGTAAGTTASASFPKGARIVEENGVTWRIDADGTRVRLGENDSRIVVENGVRYRVDPGGARVRIDERGIDLTPDIDVPDVDVGINEKGNPDIDVKDKDDGNTGPN
ncbi:MAG TPA: hypothetical protein VEA61_13160 [Allosphingosinicella sp.]|nr:hypothetical protein [Allosphingosinicella sp.]